MPAELPDFILNPSEGDEYWRSDTDQEYVFNGLGWMPVPPEEEDEEGEDEPQVRNISTKELIERNRRRNKHIKRHLISGLIVFLLSLGADILINQWLYDQRMAGPVRVFWGPGDMSDWSSPTNAPIFPVDLGAGPDGFVRWRNRR